MSLRHPATLVLIGVLAGGGCSSAAQPEQIAAAPAPVDVVDSTAGWPPARPASPDPMQAAIRSDERVRAAMHAFRDCMREQSIHYTITDHPTSVFASLGRHDPGPNAPEEARSEYWDEVHRVAAALERCEEPVNGTMETVRDEHLDVARRRWQNQDGPMR